MYVVKRDTENPILAPVREHAWESVTVLNASPVKKDDTLHLFYRAIGKPDPLVAQGVLRSIIGKAQSADGSHFSDRKPFVEPSEPWDRYGCEDPRVTFFEGRYYIFYTALSVVPFQASGIKTACAISDDLHTVAEKHPVTPFNAKAMTLFPERIDGKATLIFSAHTDEPPTKIAIAQSEHIEDFWDPAFWEQWHQHIDEHTIKLERRDGDHCEIGAAPIKTDDGWLLIYSHIQDYFDTSKRLFGIEAVLLDEHNPRTIVARTKNPILIPEEPYERYGIVSDIAFPSGALLHDDGTLDIYYGAGDTYCARASLHYPDLAQSMFNTELLLKRHPDSRFDPIPEHPWEARAVLNAGSIDLQGKVHMLYRAMSAENTSALGYAVSTDGIHFTRDLEPAYVPRADFEMKKGKPDGNSGCEDPRLTLIDERIYMCYTAYDGVNPPRVAVTHISVHDFLDKQWRAWSEPKIISPASIDDKDACILPETVRGEYMVIHRIRGHICADYVRDLHFEKHGIIRCIEMFGPRPGSWESEKVGIAGPPIKTEFGWLLIYHAVDRKAVYRLGAALLDLHEPTNIIGRLIDPIFEPVEGFEKVGEIPNVVFSCAQSVRNDTLHVYYGGADKVMATASCSLSHLLSLLTRNTP